MDEYRKIIKFINKSNSIITIDELKKNNISYYYINKLIEDNYIKRINTGIYGKTDSFDDEYYIIQKRYTKAVFSYNTALFLHGETEVTPSKIDITVPRKYNVKSFNNDIKIHYINDKFLYLGAIKVESPYGNKIITYNLERTICDIVKNNNSLDKEQINKILRNVFLSNKINGSLIIDYAKKLKCEAKIKSIMEVLI